MRHLGVRPPDPPAVETDVKTSSEILPHERFAADLRAPVEVHRVERNPLEPGTVELPQATVSADPHPGPLPETAPPPPGSVSLPRDRDAVEEREPVQVYRLEPTPMKARPAERPRERVAAERHPNPPPEAAKPFPPPVRFPETAGRAPVARWEEFHEFRHTEPKRGRGRLHLEPLPMRQAPSSKLLTADLDRERRSSSFLTITLLTIAALLAVGAILWSGSLRYRVRQQDAAMNALQERNQKLAESLAQMNGEQMTEERKASDSSADAQQNPASASPSATPSSGNSKAAAQSEEGQSSRRQTQKEQPQKRQGVAVPPPVRQRGQVSAQQRGSHYRSTDAGYAPEIVPPYPTNFKSENVAANAANSQPVPDAGAYRPPVTAGAPLSPEASQRAVPVAESAHPATSSATTPRASVPQTSAVSRLPTPSSGKTATPTAAAPENPPAAGSATQYTANGSGEYASPLAQNIEAVEGLQRHSPVQLKEFHARAGASTKATPNVRLSVQQPDQSRGSYALVVNEDGASRQLRGQVNHPLVFADTTAHREYALVILSIADQQVYGYVRAAQ